MAFFAALTVLHPFILFDVLFQALMQSFLKDHLTRVEMPSSAIVPFVVALVTLFISS